LGALAYRRDLVYVEKFGFQGLIGGTIAIYF